MLDPPHTHTHTHMHTHTHTHTDTHTHPQEKHFRFWPSRVVITKTLTRCFDMGHDVFPCMWLFGILILFPHPVHVALHVAYLMKLLHIRFFYNTGNGWGASTILPITLWGYCEVARRTLAQIVFFHGMQLGVPCFCCCFWSHGHPRLCYALRLICMSMYTFSKG